MPIDLAEVTGSKIATTKKQEQPKVANGLDKDAFMKLFLEQLKNQDPTAPMETDKIITQTAQLTQVEMQEENKRTMKEVAEAMKSVKESNDSLKDFQTSLKSTLENLDKGMSDNVDSNTNMAQVSALNTVAIIGKIAETDISGVNIKGSGNIKFSLYFDDKIDISKGNPEIQIFNSDKQLVATLPLKDKDGQAGYIDFSWDGLSDKGTQVPEGSYEIRAEYNLDPNSNKYHQTRVGRGEVESVLFNKGKPMLRMGEMILPIESAIEFYDKEKNL